jgi:hypothetical protein
VQVVGAVWDLTTDRVVLVTWRRGSVTSRNARSYPATLSDREAGWHRAQEISHLTKVMITIHRLALTRVTNIAALGGDRRSSSTSS